MMRAVLNVAAVLFLTSCSVTERRQVDETGWLDGQSLQVYGSLHSVRQGEHEARAALGHLLGPGAVHGLGVLAGLRGAATFDDGVLWISEVVNGQLHTRIYRPGDPANEHAALLGVAQVKRWKRLRLEEPLSLAEVGTRVCGATAGCTRGSAVPFRLEGTLARVELHVGVDDRVSDAPLPDSGAHRQDRISIRRTNVAARVIGFASEDLAGVLTPIGSKVSAHVVLDDQLTGHVDSLTVTPGTELLIPFEPDDR